jgi:hypothetical protein
VAARDDRLVVERLEDELLVYDVEANQAHRLAGEGAAAFDAAADDFSRRQVLRKLALAGAAAAMTTIVAPSPAQAQSPVCAPPCGQGLTCAQCPGGQPICIVGTATCCGSVPCSIGFSCMTCGGADVCGIAGVSYCCGTTSCFNAINSCCNGTCGTNSDTACGPTCQNCATSGQCCVAGACGACQSDREVKRDLEPVDRRQILNELC